MQKLLVILSLMVILSCGKKTDLDALQEFDSHIRSLEQIDYLTLFRLNNYKINENLDSLSNYVKQEINDLGLTIEQLISLQESMNEIEVTTYIRGSEYSIYLTHGSFARYYGYLLSYTNSNRKGERYQSARNTWNVGNEAIPNVYHVWTD